MAPLSLVIGNKRTSSWSLRGWLALRLAGADFEEISVPLRRGAETKAAIAPHSPSGLVPALKVSETVTLWDSLAIGEWAAEIYPEAQLWPADPVLRAQARSVASEMHSGFVPLRRDLPMAVAERAPNPDLLEEVQANIARITQVWSDCLAAHGGPFLFGPISLADVAYVPVASRFQTYGIALPEPAQAYAERLLTLPAYQDWEAQARQEPPSL